MIYDETPASVDPLPPANLFPSNYKPAQSAEDAIKALGLKFGSEILNWSKKRAQSLEPKGTKYSLDMNEIFVILAYTFDLGLKGKREDNLYFQLNFILRNRNADQLLLWRDYLYYLLNGLNKLPVFKGKVSRGIDVPLPKDKYSKASSIVWNAFSSTSTSEQVAKNFIQSSGVLFVLDITEGRLISEFSSIPSEDEVLLMPNSEWTVSLVLDTNSPPIFMMTQQPTTQPLLPLTSPTPSFMNGKSEFEKGMKMYLMRKVKDAIPPFESAAAHHYPPALVILAVIYQNAESANRIPSAALVLLAEEGDVAAQCALGIAHYHKFGLFQSFSECISWLQKAAQYPHAQYYLGCCYCRGRGADKDTKKAAKWFRRAAELGHLEAQIELGLCYVGNGVASNTDSFYFAECFENGVGVDQDMNKAKEWYQRAAAGGDERAKQELKRFG